MNLIPSIVIFPVIIGHESSINLIPMEQYEKYWSYFSIYKKMVHHNIKEINYSEPNYDKKRILIEYNDENKNRNVYDEKKNISKKDKDSDLLTLYTGIKSKNKDISKKVGILLDKTKTKDEKENAKNEIIELCKNLEVLQDNINDCNTKTVLYKSYSFNIQLLKALINELNKKENIDLGDIYNIVIQLIDIILINRVSYSALYDPIFCFIDNYFFKKVSKDQKEKIFAKLVKKYISNENIYRNVRSIIDNKIWNLFDINLFINELKKCFEANNQELWENKNFSKIFYKTSILIMIIKKKIIIKEQRDIISLKEMLGNYSQFINYLINNKNNLRQEYSNLILFRMLSLFSNHLSLTDN